MLHYTTYTLNQEKNWVTFIHGAGGSSAIWYKQIKEFSKVSNILLIDLRGHGKSKSKEYDNIKKYSFDTLGDDVIEVLDFLKIKSSSFVGISLGTIIIRELADRFPERITSMILGGAIMKLNLRAQFLMQIGAIFQSIIPYLWLYKLFAFVVLPKDNHRESRNLFIEESKKLYKGEFRRWFTLISEINPLLKNFRNTDCGIPTLYISGSEDYMFLSSISDINNQHLSSKLVIVPQCGHVVNIEKPLLFNKIALNYLDDIFNKQNQYENIVKEMI